MSAGRGPRHVLLSVLLGALGLAPGCDDAPGREQVPADQRGLERGERMLQLADICEHGAGNLAEVCAAACDLGHSNSCHVAGLLRRSAPSEALALYSRACTGGSGLGCEAAARARRAGVGCPADPAAADRLDRSARFYLRVHCEHNHARSCLVLGRLFTTARGGPPDRGLSDIVLERACSLGLAEACRPPPAAF